MPSIYIAGPMKGYPLYNFPAFDAAAALLASQGWTPINPAQLDRDAGFDPERDPVTPAFLKEAMKRDLDAVQEVDALVLLKDWEGSKGAKAEKAVAEWRGIPVYELIDGELYNQAPDYFTDENGTRWSWWNPKPVYLS